MARRKHIKNAPSRRQRPHHREVDAETFWTPAKENLWPDNPDWVAGAD